MTLLNHIPALQVLVPFFGALFAAMSNSRSMAYLIATSSSLLSLVIACYTIIPAGEEISYVFGGWNAPFGIEYRLDYLNQPIIIYVNFVLSFFLIFNKELTYQTIIKYMDNKSQHLFYAMLLFAQSGYVGVLSTNDIFNIFVFIEISSLAAYVLMSKGNNRQALIGAFDYLVLGTIGATMILISVGFLLSLTGSLNISDIAEILKSQELSNSIAMAIIFFLSGSILKVAFFPMHFWMVRAYMGAAPIMLTYIAAISSIFGTYLILRFIHFTIDDSLVRNLAISVIRPLALLTIVICTFIAMRSRNLKEVIIFSSCCQIGYVFLLLSLWEARDIMFQFLILDGINKIALFSLVAHYQNQTNDLSFKNFKYIEDNRNFKILAAFILLFSAGLPLTAMFIVKLKMFDILIANDLFLELGVVLFGGLCALLYHFKLLKALFFTPKSAGTIQIVTKNYSLIAIVFVQILALLYINDIALITDYTKIILFN